MKTLKTMTYYFQLSTGRDRKWEEIKPFEKDFDLRSDAVSFAKGLARKAGYEVRMTDNVRLLQGSYFSPNHPQS